MQLGRFPTQSTPSGISSPQDRSYSPAPPRRPHQAGGSLRPGINPRSSSLSIAASPSTSTHSLSSTVKQANGSQLRRQFNGPTSADISDPLLVLQEIVGSPSRRQALIDKNGFHDVGVERPVGLEENIDFGGLSLEAFAKQDFTSRHVPLHVHTYSAHSAQEYDQERDKFEDLHRSILACDDVLKSVEIYLTNFQTDLGAVSAEIETLQSRSMSLNMQLDNRRKVEKLLGPSVEELGIPPAVVRKISEGVIDESYSRALMELEKRYKALMGKPDKSMKALEDARPFISSLTDRAIERIRDHIVAQVKAIRSPSINAQIIQQQAFLRYRDLYAFLAKHQPQLGSDICQAYVNTMRWYYLTNFTRYEKALEQLKMHTIDKHEVLGQEETNKRTSLLSSSRTPGTSHDSFALGRRMEVLRHASHGALTAYLAEEDKSSHHIEVPFRTFNLALIDNASFEYTFLTSYFSPSHSHHTLSRTFVSVFEPTFALAQALTKKLIENTTDAFGILLCVRLNQHFAFELQRRKIPAVEGYINATNMLLWPRFQQIMDLQCESLRRMNVTGASSSLLSPTSAPSTAPHPLTQKFASFLQGIAALSSEAGDDEPVTNSLTRLRSEFEAYLTKLSKAINEQRKRERFLYNNYSLVGTILADTDGRLAGELRAHFEALKTAFSRGK
ncbi:Vps52-domain-containing protein [Pseudovirgaria hyperparasitica]|uniref:Vps52-domain-containing protein n=1 Tax=Pseudovirgaria hyperparasitica TaxID=470096 RepID=A0A6A6WJJ6_9PEZI|nr:Vps52-domain-containing protein [Pseudovirgaria hyperparasitica]KAF2762370.1 Vps52-domain-containing protein [Pseudovirgaria hyperparasitica]